MTGFASKDLPSGVRYVAIHYTADPDKRTAAYQEYLASLPLKDRLREMELHEDLWDGEPVFADYRDDLHASSSLCCIPNSKQLGNWDAGQTLIPAYVHLQITPEGQVQALFEVVSVGDDPMETFAPKVSRSISEYPALEIRRRDIQHSADATVHQRSGGTGMTAASVAKVHGFELAASSNQWEPRRSAVTWLLTDRLTDGRPRFLIDPDRCPVLRTGFLGAYKFEESPRGDPVGPGRILVMPLKNAYSHVQDALQYGAMKARSILQLDKQRTGIPTKARTYV